MDFIFVRNKHLHLKEHVTLLRSAIDYENGFIIGKKTPKCASNLHLSH